MSFAQRLKPISLQGIYVRLKRVCENFPLSNSVPKGRLRVRAVQISERISFGVQIICGLHAIGGLRENRVALG